MLTDPRTFPDASAALAEHAECYVHARSSLSAATGAESQAHDERLAAYLRRRLRGGDGAALGGLLSGAPSVDVYRHLVRVLARVAEPAADEGLAVTLFAIPLVLVAGSMRPAGTGPTLDGVVADPAALSRVLRDHGALAGNRTIAIANVLVGAASLDLPALPALLDAARLPSATTDVVPLALPPSPIEVAGGSEGAHLRFLVGTAVAAPGARLMDESGTGRWGLPLARELSNLVREPDVTLLALPRPAQSPVTAVQSGRVAQREVSAQLFMSNAVRRLRASFGEPAAVISAHRLAGGRGEVRVSLSTPFDPREAEGFRAPLHPFDRVADVAAMLIDLLRDCRVDDIRIVDGIHADRDPLTGLAVLFKPETIPPGTRVTLH